MSSLCRLIALLSFHSLVAPPAAGHHAQGRPPLLLAKHCGCLRRSASRPFRHRPRSPQAFGATGCGPVHRSSGSTAIAWVAGRSPRPTPCRTASPARRVRMPCRSLIQEPARVSMRNASLKVDAIGLGRCLRRSMALLPTVLLFSPPRRRPVPLQNATAVVAATPRRSR